MTLQDAIALLQYNSLQKEQWADLGCGSGLFTIAMTNLLASGSTIIAIDKSRDSLKNLSGTYNNVFIETREADFTTTEIPYQLDGVLMANSLHYVKDQRQFVNNLKQQLKENGTIIVVEYDTDKSNPWVPYPISFKKLAELFEQNGFADINLTGRKKSIYGSELYAAVIKRI